jgi:hypothetical protein
MTAPRPCALWPARRAAITTAGAINSLEFYWAVNGTKNWHPEIAGGPGTVG